MNTVNGTEVGPTLRIFLSYAKSDEQSANQLRRLLSQVGRINSRVFTTAALSAGGDWPKRLRDEIARSDVFIVLLSPASSDSPWVLQELGAAWALEKPIIPVVTQPESFLKLPVQLSDTQLVSFPALEDPDTLRRLLEPHEERVAGLRGAGRTAPN
jgi:hypothetical protein